MTEPTDARRDARGLVVALVLLVTMAATVVGLGVAGAFRHEPQPGDPFGRRPIVTIDGPMPSATPAQHVYRLVVPPMTKASARRFFIAAGVHGQVRAGHGVLETNRGAMVKTAMGWFVVVPGFAAVPANTRGAAPAAPSETDAIETARRTLATLGIPADRLRADAADPKTGFRTVEADRVVGGSVVRILGFTVDVGPGDVVEGLTGLLTRVVDEGVVSVRPSRAVANGLSDPTRALIGRAGRDQVALWAVTVGTNMMGYTPVFGSSVKYVLLGSGRCDIAVQNLRLESGDASGGCSLRAPTAIHIRATEPVTGVVSTSSRGPVFVVPAYRFTVRLQPRTKKQPRTTTLVVAAVDRSTLDDLARKPG